MRIFGVSLLTFLLTSTLSGAGTLGTVDSEIESLEGEIAKAQNERDQAFLDKKAKSDPSVLKAKEEALSEKRNALTRRMRELNTRPKPKVTHPVVDDHSPDDNSPEGFEQGGKSSADVPHEAPAAPRTANSPPKEQTVLSGEGVKSEIIYPKKKKGLPAKVAPEPSPSESAESPTPSVSSGNGQSEIQYPKKKSPKKPTSDSP